MSECVRHRDWELLNVEEMEGGEFGVEARCNECGQKKESLVDFTRNYANVVEVPDRE